MEVLKLLREYSTKQKPIRVENGRAYFDSVDFDIQTELPLKGQSNKDKYYKLQVRRCHSCLLIALTAAKNCKDIWYMLQKRSMPWLAYMKECQKHDFGFVAFLDYKVWHFQAAFLCVFFSSAFFVLKDLCNYLTGVTDSTTRFDPNFRPTMPTPAAASTTAASAPGLSCAFVLLIVVILSFTLHSYPCLAFQETQQQIQQDQQQQQKDVIESKTDERNELDALNDSESTQKEFVYLFATDILLWFYEVVPPDEEDANSKTAPSATKRPLTAAERKGTLKKLVGGKRTARFLWERLFLKCVCLCRLQFVEMRKRCSLLVAIER